MPRGGWSHPKEHIWGHSPRSSDGINAYDQYINQRSKWTARVLSAWWCRGVAARGLSPESIIAQMSCNDSAPPTDDILAISCAVDSSRSDDMRLGDAAPSVHYTHTHTQPFNGLLSRTTLVGRYQKKHWPAHTHPDDRTSFIIFLHLQRSKASSLFSLRAWQSSRTTSLQVLFGLSLGLGPTTSYSMHFFTQSSSSFRSTCPYQRSLFCCNTTAMSTH